MNRALLALALASLVLAGCSSDAAPERVPTKDDFAKKPKPEGYHGPGEPGGPGSGPVPGPPSGGKGVPDGK